MSLQYLGLDEINGPLVFLDHVEGVGYEEMVEIRCKDGSSRMGRVVQLEGSRAAIQVFEGTNGLSLTNTRTRFKGKPMELPLSLELLGRVFNGSGRPIDGLGEVYAEKSADINGLPLNPVSRVYPRNYINTGISSIDALMTLIRGQKLPIFSGSGMPHNELAMDRVVMLLNLANDPIIERTLTPRCALTAAEYLAFEHGMHVLVIMTDITSYCEALREFSSSKGEIPGRKGYPGYLYSDLASMYERAGIMKGSGGSVTQIPILTMPNDDITHPIPDLTGYITEGQIVLDRELNQTGVYPPVGVLPSLSRLMKDGIGEGYTRKDHSDVSNQLFAAYAKVQDARSLASVIGEDELSETDKQYMSFGTLFEQHFLNQGFDSNRTIDETLDLGWDLLSVLPRGELDRIDNEVLEEHYDPQRAAARFHLSPDPIIRELKKPGE